MLQVDMQAAIFISINIGSSCHLDGKGQLKKMQSF